MASWTLVETLTAGYYGACWNAVYDDNDRIYLTQYDGSDWWPYQYVVSTDTLTQIGDATSFNGDDLDGGENSNALAYFKGNLYCCLYAGSNIHEVWRYDGSGVSWTRVAQWDLGIGWAGNIATDGNQLVFIEAGVGYDPEAWTTIKYTSNGTSWSTGSVDLTPDRPSGTYNYKSLTWHGINFTERGLHGYLYMTYGVWPYSVRYAFHLCEWDGSQFTTIAHYDSTPSGEDWVINDYELCDRNFWRGLGGSWWQFSPDVGSWTDMDDPDIFPDRQFGVGYNVGNDNADWVYSNNGIWGTPETIRAGSGYLMQMFRFTETGEMVAIVGTGVAGASQRYIYTRDDPFEPPAPPGESFARFYHGEGTLVEKFLLPFTGVMPGAMTLDRSLGTVVIGSDTPDEHMIVYSRHSYSSYTVSDDGFPTGTAITSLKWI